MDGCTRPWSCVQVQQSAVAGRRALHDAWHWRNRACRRSVRSRAGAPSNPQTGRTAYAVRQTAYAAVCLCSVLFQVHLGYITQSLLVCRCSPPDVKMIWRCSGRPVRAMCRFRRNAVRLGLDVLVMLSLCHGGCFWCKDRRSAVASPRDEVRSTCQAHPNLKGPPQGT